MLIRTQSFSHLVADVKMKKKEGKTGLSRGRQSPQGPTLVESKKAERKKDKTCSTKTTSQLRKEARLSTHTSHILSINHLANYAFDHSCIHGSFFTSIQELLMHEALLYWGSSLRLARLPITAYHWSVFAKTDANYQPSERHYWSMKNINKTPTVGLPLWSSEARLN